MRYRYRRTKGMIIIVSLFVAVVLLGLVSVTFMRVVSVNNASKINNNSLQAFYEAESGRAYAYAELAAHGFNWYTHIDKDTHVPSGGANNMDGAGNIIVFADAGGSNFITAPGAYIDTASGCYCVNDNQGNRRFQVKVYPEQIGGVYTGTVVVLSQGMFNGLMRTVEHRIDQPSAYKYFFFYPYSKTFSSDVFNGRNYGAIHVNGDIRLTGSPKFYFLTELTCGSNTDGEGYIYRPLKSRYYDWHGELDYSTSLSDPTTLPYYLYLNTNYHFYTGNTYFRSGEMSSYVDTTLPYYLDNNTYSGAYWEYDKYAGDGTDTTPAHYSISNDDLKNLAIYELCAGSGGIPLLNGSSNVTIPSVGTGNEEEIFEDLYNKPGNNEGLWDEFWTQWKANHANDYQQYHGTTLTGGEDWERRFFMAAYEWRDRSWDNDGQTYIDIPDGIPDNINREWWEDLSYGDDRAGLSNDMAPAAVERSYNGEQLDLYFLNTEEQAVAWRSWLSGHSLDEAGEDMTLVKDRSQGGQYVDQGTILSTHTDQDAVRDKAKNGGIYIGLEDGAFSNPISDCSVETQFYNVTHPAGFYSRGQPYRPSNILVIDVYALKEKIENEMSDFNGVVYVDLESYPWSSSSYDANADGVMLVNGERLPDGGLSIVSPNNVFIKGNYNLDPVGNSDKNRDPDSESVISYVTAGTHYSRIDGSPYTLSANDLVWQPAEIISTRAVYTLSDDFPEPSYMPMNGSVSRQYYEEDNYGHLPGHDFVTGHYYYPTDDWVPSPSDTRAAYSAIDTWFTYYNGGQTLPARWDAEWVYANWPSDTVFSFDTNGNGQIDTYILGSTLQSYVRSHIQSAYSNTYNYTAIHGRDGSLNSDTPSFINSVSQPHIYNAAIVSPYSTSPYVLEYWRSGSGDTARIINGAFVQLPTQFRETTPRGVYYGRARSPANTFNYETRFGRGADPNDRPPVGLTFGANVSWREISNSRF